MARALTAGWTDEIRGIGIDEETAVLLEPDGTGSVTGAGAAWFLQMTKEDIVACRPAEALVTRSIEAVVARAGASFDTSSWDGDVDACVVDVVHGSVRFDGG